MQNVYQLMNQYNQDLVEVYQQIQIILDYWNVEHTLTLNKNDIIYAYYDKATNTGSKYELFISFTIKYTSFF